VAWRCRVSCRTLRAVHSTISWSHSALQLHFSWKWQEAAFLSSICLVVCGSFFLQWYVSNEVLVWLSVWCHVQIVCIQSSWCHCIPKPRHLLPHLIQTGFTLLVPTYPGCPGKEAVKLVCVFHCNNSCYIFLYKHVFSLFICYYDEQK